MKARGYYREVPFPLIVFAFSGKIREVLVSFIYPYLLKSFDKFPSGRLLLL